VLVTNEFDAVGSKPPARSSGNAYLFTAVVHVNPVGVLRVYGDTGRGSATELPGLVESGRLISLEQWLLDLLS
jgi:hypothetical protein